MDNVWWQWPVHQRSAAMLTTRAKPNVNGFGYDRAKYEDKARRTMHGCTRAARARIHTVNKEE